MLTSRTPSIYIGNVTTGVAYVVGRVRQAQAASFGPE